MYDVFARIIFSENCLQGRVSLRCCYMIVYFWMAALQNSACTQQCISRPKCQILNFCCNCTMIKDNSADILVNIFKTIYSTVLHNMRHKNKNKISSQTDMWCSRSRIHCEVAATSMCTVQNFICVRNTVGRTIISFQGPQFHCFSNNILQVINCKPLYLLKKHVHNVFPLRYYLLYTTSTTE